MKHSRIGLNATIVWLFLVAATLLSWRIRIHSNDANFLGVKLESIMIILIALFKIRCVLLYFMQLRTAPLVWRIIFESWLLIVAVAMLVIYEMPAGRSPPPAASESRSFINPSGEKNARELTRMDAILSRVTLLGM